MQSKNTACCLFAAAFSWAVSLAAVAAPELLVTSFGTNRIGRYDIDSGAFLGRLTGRGLDAPLATRVGPDGLLYVANEGTSEILRYDPTTLTFQDVFVTSGAGGLDAPTGMTWGPDGDMYVPSFNTDTVLRYDGETGAFIDTFIGTAGLNGPDNGTIFGPDGHLYVPSYFSNRVRRYDGVSGALLNEWTVQRPRVLVFDETDTLHVTSETRNTVARIDIASGARLEPLFDPGSGGVDTPIGLARGPDDLWYVASAGNDSVLRYDADGNFVDTLLDGTSDGGINLPVFLTFIPEPAALTGMLLGLLLLRRER